MGSNEGHACVSLGGVDHVDLSEGFFGLRIISELLFFSYQSHSLSNILLSSFHV